MVGIGFGTSVQHLTSAVTARRFRAELHAPRKHPEIKKKKKKAVENKKKRDSFTAVANMALQ